MDAIASAVLNKIYAFTINFLRVKVIESIEEGDASLDVLRSQLQDQFEQLHDKINKLLIEPLRTAEQNVRLGMTHLDINEQDEAVLHFRQAQQNAIAAVTTATSFEGKMIATKIQLLCVLHIRGYFTESYNPVGLNKVLDTVFQQLCNLPEVQSAFEGRTKGRSLFRMLSGSSGRAKEVDIVSAVLDLQKQLRGCTSGDYHIVLKGGKALNPVVDLRLSTFGVKTTFSMTKAESIQSVNEKIYTTFEDAKIRVYDADTMTLLVTLQGIFGDKIEFFRRGCLMVTDKSIFYTSNYSTVVAEWSVDTYKHLGTIDVAPFSAVKDRNAGRQGISAATVTATHLYLVLTGDTSIYVFDLKKNDNAGASGVTTCGYDSSFSCGSFTVNRPIMSMLANNGKLYMFTYQSLSLTFGYMLELDLASHNGVMHRLCKDSENPSKRYQEYANPRLGWRAQVVVRAASYHSEEYRHVAVDGSYVYAVRRSRCDRIEQWDLRTNQLVHERGIGDVESIVDMIIVSGKLYCLTPNAGIIMVFI